MIITDRRFGQHRLLILKITHVRRVQVLSTRKSPVIFKATLLGEESKCFQQGEGLGLVGNCETSQKFVHGSKGDS